MKRIIAVSILMVALVPFILAGCVTTPTKVDGDKTITAPAYPVKDSDKGTRIDKEAEWKLLDRTYGPAEVEIFYVHGTKIKRYTYRGAGVTYRVLFYNDKIESIVTDR